MLHQLVTLVLRRAKRIGLSSPELEQAAAECRATPPQAPALKVALLDIFSYMPFPCVVIIGMRAMHVARGTVFRDT